MVKNDFEKEKKENFVKNVGNFMKNVGNFVGIKSKKLKNILNIY